MPRHWTNSPARRHQRSAVNYRLPIAPSPLPKRSPTPVQRPDQSSKSSQGSEQRVRGDR